MPAVLLSHGAWRLPCRLGNMHPPCPVAHSGPCTPSVACPTCLTSSSRFCGRQHPHPTTLLYLGVAYFACPPSPAPHHIAPVCLCTRPRARLPTRRTARLIAFLRKTRKSTSKGAYQRKAAAAGGAGRGAPETPGAAGAGEEGASVRSRAVTMPEVVKHPLVSGGGVVVGRLPGVWPPRPAMPCVHRAMQAGNLLGRHGSRSALQHASWHTRGCWCCCSRANTHSSTHPT